MDNRLVEITDPHFAVDLMYAGTVHDGSVLDRKSVV